MQTKIYRSSGRFKSLLLIVALLLISVMLFYTHRMVNTLRADSRQILEFYAHFYQRAAQDASGEELNFIFEEIKRMNFPIIQSDINGEPTGWKGIGIDPGDYSEETRDKVRTLMNAMKREGDPIPIHYDDHLIAYLYYGDSKSIRQLQMLPYVQIAAVGLFILVGFVGFNSIRHSEQQFIWVGMAKETAHQLGTPISSLHGWLEYLQGRQLGDEQAKILLDMQQDVQRLDKVANRFSQIGSQAALEPVSLDQIIDNVLAYFERRLPQMGKKVTLRRESTLQQDVPVNADLMEWVFENLIKNALDAIDGPSGSITIRVQPPESRKHRAIIDVIDTGKGIDNHARKNIFKPGFSTKKRGWGLGLSLVQRIVEEYHGGKLLLKETRVGKGTTIRVVV